MNKSVILIGGFHEIIELCEDLNYSIIGVIDNILSGNYFNYPILGSDSDVGYLYSKYNKIPLILTPDSPTIRKRLFQLYSEYGFSFETVISSSASISKNAKIGQGTIVQRGVNISSNTTIGRFVKLNTNSNIMHDCNIGDYSTIAPNAVVLGNIQIGKEVYVGANSTILPNRVINNNIIIGAGAVVTKDIEETNSKYIGIPAKKIMK